MKIALISFEYPPDTAYGGIATYAHQAATLLTWRGHTVEVFAGSRDRSGTDIEGAVTVHRIQVKQKIDFIRAVVPIFLGRHQATAFDVVEGPEYGADAAGIAQAVPDLPLVVKLHTPRELIDLYEGQPNAIDQLRTRLGALRRGIHPLRNLEQTHTLEADEIAAPSWALGKDLIQRWGLNSAKVHQYPLPFTPDPNLLAIPVNTSTQRVTFIGRLDIKKGVVDLADAIPLVLAQLPTAQFRLIGRNGQSPIPQIDMQTFLTQRLQSDLASVEFTGPVPADRIPDYLANTDICVFPSRWESFGLVCLEAMTAARGVIGSSAGGMAEIITSYEVGRLVPPQNPAAIAAAIIELLNDPDLRMELGHNARQRVLAEYSGDRIGQLQEASYQRAIEAHQAAGRRRRRLWL
ncbi:glycosyltransferase family 4 protein [Nodosilinea sp. LEGE 07088]|uniref:glycosyltransferase family 4 protein n=1 Tax=Nodosilinea sp. LEGE 07088 TaxID=2777968 RepID=UPI00187EC396|nr:glycosyltransferase family 4 protein [Nodosilinea sp. LEGE 07088]MBE9139442.1 glycosyltransferase family 4 protein [Nodosilinea sp. LEGE 07088]